MLEKFKQHVKKHKELYIGLSLGIVATVLVARNIDSIKASTFINSPYKSKITEVHLERRGHPGNIVRCVQTGELFASQNRAGEMLGVNPSEISRNIRGLVPDVHGFTFELVGVAA